MTMSLFTLQSRCTNPTKHPLHRPSVDQTVKSKQPPIHRLLPRIPFPPISNRHLSRWNMCPPPRILPRVGLSEEFWSYSPVFIPILRRYDQASVTVPTPNNAHVEGSGTWVKPLISNSNRAPENGRWNT